MSSTKEKLLCTLLAGAVGVPVGFFYSPSWGFAAAFAVYTVAMLDRILDRLDAISKRNEAG